MKPSLHPKAFLMGRGLRPKKSFGQNFLTDQSALADIARRVIRLADDDDHSVVELGPGLGALTVHLLDKGARLQVVERDRDLVPVLSEHFADEVERGQLTIHEANAATFDVAAHLQGLTPGKSGRARGALCGNLPYHLTSDLLFNAQKASDTLGGAVFLIQLEVAERVAAGPGSKTYGVLSVLLQHTFDVELVRVVKKGAFWPVPDVDGGVLELRTRDVPRGGNVDGALLKEVVKTAFSQRRKTLRNTLKKTFADAVSVLEACDIDPGARAETIAVEGFCDLARALDEERARGADNPGT